MKNSEAKKPNKYVVLATYLVVVVCLLLGLFLPLFNGKDILALQLLEALKKIAGKDSSFVLPYDVDLFGLGFNMDLFAYVTVLYTVVTALSLLALIPVGIGVKADRPFVNVLIYIVEVAAIIVASLYLAVALMDIDAYLSYNFLIALGGSVLMLFVLSCISKKGNGALKLVLFLLSAVGLLALYDFSVITDKLGAVYDGETGISHFALLIEGGLKDALGAFDAKGKAALIFGLVLAITVLLNYFIDTISLSTNAKKAGHIFNLIRYGIELVAAACALITVAVCKYEMGIMLIIIANVALVETVISVLRYILFLKNANREVEIVEEDDEPKVFYKPLPEENFDEIEEPSPFDKKPTAATLKADAPDKHMWDDDDMEDLDDLEDLEDEDEGPVQMEVDFDDLRVDRLALPARTTPEPYTAPPSPIPPAPSPIPEIRPQPQPQPQPEPVQPQPAAQQVYNQPVQQVYVPPVQPQPRVYTINTIYGGPVDDFMKKLTNDEKIEFAMVFIEKSKGNIGNIPEYVIGGNNRTFFSSVFIYLGRIRGLISDGLLNKMYKELNML